jgi:hypothetical protein
VIDQDNDGFDDVQELKANIVEDGWRNRRAIAWISFITAITYPLLLVGIWQFSEPLVDKLIDLSTPLFTLCGVNLTWYFTMSTWENIKK